MRYLILSDIHANYVALEAVMNDAESKQWDDILFLGDAVGYYPQPGEVLDALSKLKPSLLLLGNHDALLLKLLNKKAHKEDYSKSIVADVLQRQVKVLNETQLRFLASFKLRDENAKWQAVHGALTEAFDYLNDIAQAQRNFPLMKAQLCFIGHTHVPIIYGQVTQDPKSHWRAIAFRESSMCYRIPPHAKLIINPGSVGQARDGDPRASYSIFDDEAMKIEMYRVAYDYKKVATLIAEHNYPEVLAQRLIQGR